MHTAMQAWIKSWAARQDSKLLENGTTHPCVISIVKKERNSPQRDRGTERGKHKKHYPRIWSPCAAALGLSVPVNPAMRVPAGGRLRS